MNRFRQTAVMYDAVDCATGEILCANIRRAETWLAAGWGLLGAGAVDLRPLLLLNTNAIHTIGMSLALDIAFLDEHGVCLGRIDGLRPWRVAFGPPRTWMTLETKASYPSVLERITPGTRIAFTPAEKS